MNQVLLVKEHPKIEFKKQSNAKSTSLDLMMVKVPSITTNSDIYAPISTKYQISR